MPTYDYGCPECGHSFEVFEGLSASGLRDCPKCGGRKSRRLLSAGSGFILKGAGFYNTDYRQGGVKSSTSPAKSEAKSEKKAESSTSA